MGATKGSLAHCGIWVWAFQTESHKIEFRLGPIDIIGAAPTQIIHGQNYIFHGHLNKTSDNALREGHSCNSSKIKSFSLATLVNFLCKGLVLTNNHPAILLLHSTRLINVMSLITSAGTNLSTLKNAQDHNLTPPMQTDIIFSLLSLNYTAHRILQKKKILLPRSLPIWHYRFIHQRIWILYWFVKKTIFKQLKRYRKPDFPLDGYAMYSCRDDQKKSKVLNYALRFCSGDIIGVYDAEDATEPDHLLKVAEQFASAGQNTTYLQCGLIYFSANTRFISRCFVNEYTSCFCTFLPKLLKLGVLIPPGRTTLFFGVLF